MSRSERLFDLLDVLRRHRHPVSGRKLAEETAVSLRTLYRDIASLQALGANIEGEPGVGYILRPGFLLPPLSFPVEEIEALALGAHWVSERGDGQLRAAAQSALARLAAVLPTTTKAELDATALFVAPAAPLAPCPVDIALMRQAIRTERKLAIRYRDGADTDTERVIWPFALAYFEDTRLLLGWCELRKDFRNFRADRILTAELSPARYPTSKRTLLHEWRRAEGIPAR